MFGVEEFENLVKHLLLLGFCGRNTVGWFEFEIYAWRAENQWD
jgi:hypothetical protein